MKSETDIEHLFVRTFGMSSEAFERELAAEFEQATPEELAELEELVKQANIALPKMNASLDRTTKNLAGMNVTMEELKGSMASLNERVTHIEGSFEAMICDDAVPEDRTRH